jgi:hypothetical protein
MIGGSCFPHNEPRFIILIMSYGLDTLDYLVVQPHSRHRFTHHNSYFNQQTLFFNIVCRTLCPKRRHCSVTRQFSKNVIRLTPTSICYVLYFVHKECLLCIADLYLCWLIKKLCDCLSFRDATVSHHRGYSLHL